MLKLGFVPKSVLKVHQPNPIVKLEITKLSAKALPLSVTPFLPVPPTSPLHTGNFSSGDGEHVRVSGLGYSPSMPALGLFYLLNFTEMHATPHPLTSHIMSGGDAKQFLMFWAK